jgi:SAM-dependent methyltransferase
VGRAEEVRALTEEAREIWNRKASFWDEQFGDEGNRFHRTLVGPAVERLLGLRPGERVLDVACGNGAFARRLAELGAHVTAIDFSEALLERARARTTAHADRIEYRLLDATDAEQLGTLAPGYDAAVCNQALMDMATLDPLFVALHRRLAPGGRFVFSVSHPCFNSAGSRRVIEEEEQDGEARVVHAVRVSRYIQPQAGKGVGIVGEPAPHLCFDRPLSALLGAGFRAGFVLDGLEEPVYPANCSGARWFSWANYHEIPPVLVGRMRIPLRGAA